MIVGREERRGIHQGSHKDLVWGFVVQIGRTVNARATTGVASPAGIKEGHNGASPTRLIEEARVENGRYLPAF